MKRFIVFTGVLLATSLSSYRIGLGEPAAHQETVLFAASGFTNKTGDAAAERQRAVQAAVAYVGKQIVSLFGSADGGDEQNTVLTAALSERLEIVDTSDLPAGLAGDSLAGVRVVGKVTVDMTSASAVFKAPHSLLSATIATEKEVFRLGEKIVFFLDGNRDFFACILDRNEQGAVVQLLPNGLRFDNRFSGNRRHRFPDPAKGDNYDLEVSPPFGRETIYFIASEKQFAPPLPDHRQTVFASSTEDMGVLLKRVHDALLDSLRQEPDDTAFQRIQVTNRILSVTTREGT